MNPGSLPRGEDPLQAVEDQVEAEQVLVAVVVAGLEDVLDGDLGEVEYSEAGNAAMIAWATSAASSGVWKGRLASWRANP